MSLLWTYSVNDYVFILRVPAGVIFKLSLVRFLLIYLSIQILEIKLQIYAIYMEQLWNIILLRTIST